MLVSAASDILRYMCVNESKKVSIFTEFCLIASQQNLRQIFHYTAMSCKGYA